MELYELTLVVTRFQEEAIRNLFTRNDWKLIIAGGRKGEQSTDVSPTKDGKDGKEEEILISPFCVNSQVTTSRVSEDLDSDVAKTGSCQQGASVTAKSVSTNGSTRTSLLQAQSPSPFNSSVANDQSSSGEQKTAIGRGEAITDQVRSNSRQGGGGRWKAINEQWEAISGEEETISGPDDSEDESLHVEDLPTEKVQKGGENGLIHCLECGETFTDNHRLEMHVKVHESPRRRTSSRIASIRQLRTSPRKPDRQKTTYGSIFKKLSLTNRHREPLTPDKRMPPKRISEAKEKEFKCATCGKQFQTVSNLSDHLQSHVKVMPFFCRTCGEMFIDPDTFKEHLTGHCHKVVSRQLERQIKQMPFVCSTCGEMFRDRDTLEEHTKDHEIQDRTDDVCRKPDTSCKTCGKSFANQSALANHERVHSGEKQHLCTDCGKLFKEKGQLRTHIRTHTGEKPYKCKLCDAAFVHSGELQRHNRKHTGDKPHLCTVCGKNFAELGYLKSHLRLHTGEKPYQCKYCGKSFSQRTSLKVHIKCHHQLLGANVSGADQRETNPNLSSTSTADRNLLVPFDACNTPYFMTS